MPETRSFLLKFKLIPNTLNCCYTVNTYFLRHEILNSVWGKEVIVGDRTNDVHIRKIRQKIGIDCKTTVKGVGYKFEL